MGRRAVTVLGTVLLLLLADMGVAPAADQTPTELVSDAKALGIKKPGHRYRYHDEQSTSEEGRLTVDFPVPWSAIAESRFRRPDTNEPYGVGLRATTDADKFHNSFDVPGVKVTATTELPDRFDPDALVEANAYTGCRAGVIAPYDNGRYEGSYQTFSRCDRKRAAAVVVVAVDARAGVMVLVAGQALTKADLAAFDRALRSAAIEKTSV
jgi:hypothetical protein